MDLSDLIFIAITMLLGEEGIDYAYYTDNKEWWALRLYVRYGNYN